MNSLDDYEILKILGGSLSSACYKVKEKKSSELKVLRVISYETNEFKDKLVEKLTKRMLLKDHIFLKFCNYILHESAKVLYVVTEYCKYGSFYNIIRKGAAKKRHLKEEFLWYILHQLISNFKSTSELRSNLIDLKEVYLDSLFDIKFLYLNQDHLQNNRSQIGNCIGKILLQLSCLNTDDNIDKIDIPNFYSDNLKNVITYMLEADLRLSLDIILWHPMLSTKKIKKFNSSIFITKKNDSNQRKIGGDGNNLQSKIENLKNREIAVQIQESKLKEIENSLAKREKKVTQLEKDLRDRLAQADLYLKRVRKQNTDKENKIEFEYLDNSSLDYCESVIISTSNKLIHDSNKLTCSKSERRVKFKGHSPLKVIQNVQNVKSKIKCNENAKIDCEKKVDKLQSKKRFSLRNMFTKKSINRNSETSQINRMPENFNADYFKPIVWTEENKRQAFSLLRIMNSESSSLSMSEDCNVKHTKM